MPFDKIYSALFTETLTFIDMFDLKTPISGHTFKTILEFAESTFDCTPSSFYDPSQRESIHNNYRSLLDQLCINKLLSPEDFDSFFQLISDHLPNITNFGRTDILYLHRTLIQSHMQNFRTMTMIEFFMYIPWQDTLTIKDLFNQYRNSQSRPQGDPLGAVKNRLGFSEFSTLAECLEILINRLNLSPDSTKEGLLKMYINMTKQAKKNLMDIVRIERLLRTIPARHHLGFSEESFSRAELSAFYF